MIPSLLQIPSAVSDSKLHSVLPNNGKGDFTFDRSTGATRINRDGLIEEVGYFSSELVQNGNFSELGSEALINGDFATDSDWSKGTGWVITNGYAESDGTNAPLDQVSRLTIGKTYKVVITVTNMTSSALSVRLGTSSSNAVLSILENGTYTAYGVAGATTFRLRSQGFDGRIQNVSVKQVDPNDRWTLSSGFSFGNNQVEYTSGSVHNIQQSNVVEANKTYEVNIITSQPITVYLGSNTVGTTIGSGSRKLVLTAASNTNGILYVGTGAAYSGNISLISVKEVLGDRPRLSYDITNGVVEDKPHLLLENSSTNLITFSNDYTQTFWTKQQVGIASAPVVTSNYAISPDGTRNADRVVFNLNGATNSDFSQLATSLTTSVGNITNSVYIKSNTDSNYVMNFTKASGANEIITVTNEWQRFEATLNNATTSSAFRIRLRHTESTSNYADVSIFGAQLEQESYATSFIPTAGTIISRASETCNNSKPSVNSTEGVLYAEIQALVNDNSRRSISISDGSSSNRVVLRYDNVSNRVQGFIQVSGSTNGNISTEAYTITDTLKIAYKWKASDFALWVNGTEVTTSTSSTSFGAGVLNEIDFNDAAGSQDFYGKVKGLAVYNEALSESQLMQLTGVTASSIYSNFVTRTASFTVEALNEVKKVIDNL
jgi:hypothetical protein